MEDRRLRYWIARDSGGALYLYKNYEKPVRTSCLWIFSEASRSSESDIYRLSEGRFPEITWEGGPCEVEVPNGDLSLIRKIDVRCSEVRREVLEGILKDIDSLDGDTQELLLKIFDAACNFKVGG